ncbi:Uncharacterised protein [Mycobacterium tuberculosis]|nr:Uncharacterised protein [Mycobacterium tuberculosis]
MRGIEAVACVSLGVIHVGLIGQAANLRQAIGADTDHAAPLEVDLHVSQLWKHLEHFWPHIGANILGIATGVVAGPTKQQAAVGGQSEVVHGYPLITHSHILR